MAIIPPKYSGIDNQQVITALNDLVAAARDSAALYGYAADIVTDAALSAFMSNLTVQRKDHIGQLRDLITQLGGDSKPNKTATPLPHGGVRDLKDHFSVHCHATSPEDHELVVVLCEQRESAMRNAYMQALYEVMPDDVHAIVYCQATTSQKIHERIVALLGLDWETHLAQS